MSRSRREPSGSSLTVPFALDRLGLSLALGLDLPSCGRGQQHRNLSRSLLIAELDRGRIIGTSERNPVAVTPGVLLGSGLLTRDMARGAVIVDGGLFRQHGLVG